MPDGETTTRLTELFIDLHPGEAAQILEPMAADEVAALLERQSTGRAAAILERLNPQLGADCLRNVAEATAPRLLAAISPSRAAAILVCLDDESRAGLVERIEPRLARELEDLMSYPAESAGHLMDPRVYGVPAGLTVQDVLDRLHTLRRQRVQTVFLVDEEGRLVGAMPLHDVILGEPQQRLSELIAAPPVHVQATAPRGEVVSLLADYRLASLPVVDFDGRLIGTIRRDAMIEAVRAEATAGLQTMVGASGEERALSSALFAVRKRLPWLNVNLLTAFLAAAVVGLFEDTIAKFTALAVLLPVVAGQSGNTGAQALAVTMRGLALREVRTRQWMRVMVKEAVAGFVNGVAIAAVTMVGVYVWSRSLGLCAVIGLAMVIAMAIAGAAGTAIPMLLTAMRLDPAQSSSIVLTTVTDVIGFFSFLGLATLLAQSL